MTLDRGISAGIAVDHENDFPRALVFDEKVNLGAEGSGFEYVQRIHQLGLTRGQVGHFTVRLLPTEAAVYPSTYGHTEDAQRALRMVVNTKHAITFLARDAVVHLHIGDRFDSIPRSRREVGKGGSGHERDADGETE